MGVTSLESLQSTVNANSEYDQQHINSRAILHTNEVLNPEILHRQPAPGGPLVGVGLGMSLVMLDAYQGGEPPSIVLFDINTPTVLAGKVFVRLLSQCQNYQDLLNYLADETTVNQVFGQEVQSSPIFEGMDDQVNSFIYQQFCQFATQARNGQPNIIAQSVEKHFSTLSRLAREDRFDFYLGDLSDPNWNTGISQYLSSQSSQPLIYISNTPDYICNSQLATTTFNQQISQLSRLNPVWISTTFSQGYQLNITDNTPHFLVSPAIPISTSEQSTARGQVYPQYTLMAERNVTISSRDNHSLEVCFVASEPTHPQAFGPRIIVPQPEGQVPISATFFTDGHGLQCHLHPGQPGQISDIKDTNENRQWLASLNLPGEITDDTDGCLFQRITINGPPYTLDIKHLGQAVRVTVQTDTLVDPPATTYTVEILK